MLILLPPSEAKSAPVTSLPSALSFDELSAVRQRVRRALIKMSSGNQARASKALGLGHTQLDQLAMNAKLDTAACGPAIDVYSGVVFEALAADSMTLIQRKRMHDHVVIATGLYGLVRPLDSIAPYRLSANSKVTGLPTLPSLWRKPIARILESSGGPILDLRSQAYVTLAPIPRDCLSRSISVRVLQEQDGKRSVVSHFNKATKGALVGALIRKGELPASLPVLLKQLRVLGYECELQELPNAAARLDIITHYTPGKVSTSRK
ncbi:MAG: peroxide stress protein YaaA [Actinomycetota bacterium]|nr:peroxide stress protein YaaA [Actinomycetota bacterium]